MSYTLQDLRCIRCNQIKRDNLTLLCSCGGTFETLISSKDIYNLFKTFLRVADTHKMALLREIVTQYQSESMSSIGSTSRC